MATKVFPTMDPATGWWHVLGCRFQTEEGANAFINAQGQRWFQRSVGHRAPGRRAIRNADRANGILGKRRFRSGRTPLINPNRDARSAASGRLRKELRP